MAGLLLDWCGILQGVVSGLLVLLGDRMLRTMEETRQARRRLAAALSQVAAEVRGHITDVQRVLKRDIVLRSLSLDSIAWLQSELTIRELAPDLAEVIAKHYEEVRAFEQRRGLFTLDTDLEAEFRPIIETGRAILEATEKRVKRRLRRG